jgi:hypothetical protein
MLCRKSATARDIVISMLPSFVVELEEVDIDDERDERLSVL